MTMYASKCKKLEAVGYQVGDAADVVGLSPEEAALINMKVKLSKQLVELRKKGGFSQGALAKMIASSQSRVAKMEAGDSAVFMVLMFKPVFALGADQIRVGKFITSPSGGAATKPKAAANKKAVSGKSVAQQKAAVTRKASARAAVA